MNEQDLRERLELSVGADRGQTVVDPTADITRGRKRLRRTRIVSGFAAATSVAAVAALGMHFLPAGSQAPAPAAQPTVTGEQFTRQGQQMRSTAAVYRHVDPTRAYTAEPAGWTFAQEVGGKATVRGAILAQEWRQDGGVGQLYVSVSDPTRAETKESWCGPDYFKERVKVTCTTGKAPNGRPIVIGAVGTVVNSAGMAYRDSGGQFVRYVRPDGLVIVVAMLRLNTLQRTAEDVPAGVMAPAVTLDQLTALAIDPDMTLSMN